MTFQTILKISKKQKVKSGQQGVTLLLAILLLSAILAISFSLTTILLFQVRNSEDFAQTSGAFYAANGVAEQALFNTERQVASPNYVTSFNNNAALSGQPVSTSTTTPIFHDSVSSASSFAGTKNKYDFCGSAATTAGCGYGKLVLTYLSTGNTDPLIVYLCQFDPNQNYTTAPCTSTSTPEQGSSYWITTQGTTNGSGNGIIDGAPAYPNGTIMTASGASTLTWNVNPLLQQQLIVYNPATDGKAIYISMETFAADGVTPLGLPFSGKTAVSIATTNGETGRKIQVIVPAPGNSANVISIPVVAGVVPMPGAAPWSVYVSGNYAYVGDYYNGTLSIYDISTPSTPVFVKSTTQNLTALPADPKDGSGNPYSPVWSIYVSGNYAYVLSYYNNTMSVYDISNPNNIVAKGVVSTVLDSAPSDNDVEPNKVVVSGNYAYVLSKYDYLSIFNISNPNSITAVSTYHGNTNISSCRGLYVSGNYAYVTCDGINTIQVYDISNPANIVALGSSSADLATPYVVYVSGNYAYVANWSETDGLAIFDISNPNNVVPLGQNNSNVNSAQGLAIVGNEAYVLNNTSGTLAMFNVANVNNIIENNEISVGSEGSPGAMATSGNYGYITNAGDANLTVVKFP